ncbi:tetratricopeptide repeat-containing sensor histidine kinase [uncultured Pedobacter sp.]|uniref:ATP-binding protein n=1 Tax=uncultured Pedobacter sp. TaxID=246139 RepID=UPI0025D8DDDA|nr:tetratricopeptide repeat-containing sensor histidine kinase [uncultured Pedobacter sp.]
MYTKINFYYNSYTKLSYLFILIVLLFNPNSQVSAKLLTDAPADTTRINSLLDSISKYRYQPDSVLKYADLGIAHAKSIAFDKGLSKLLLRKGIALMNKGLKNESLTSLNEAEKLANKSGQLLVLANVNRIRGVLYYKNADYEQATANILRAISFYERNKVYVDLPICYSILASIGLATGNTAESFRYYFKSFNLIRTLLTKAESSFSKEDWDKLHTNYIDLCVNIGNYYELSGNVDTALYYYELGLSKPFATPNYNAYLILMTNASKIYYAKGNVAKARKMAQRSLNLAREANLYREQSNALDHLGSFADHFTQANQYFSEAVELAKKSQDKDLLWKVLEHRANSAKKFGNYKFALEAYEESRAIRDSIVTQENRVAIDNLISNHKLQDSTQKLKQVGFERYKANQRSNFYRLLFAATGVILLITFLFILRNRKLNKALNLRTSQLGALNTHKDRILSIMGHDLKGALSALHALAFLLKRNMGTPRQEELIEQLSNVQQSANEILDKLLLWGALDMPYDHVMAPFYPSLTLSSTINSTRGIATARNIALTTDIPTDFEILGNEHHIEFILRNLLSNAVKYSDADQPVHIRLIRTNVAAIFEVENHNKAANISSVNDFYTNKQSVSEETKGHGIGLLLCKILADLDHYQLTASKEGDLICIRLIIPANPGASIIENDHRTTV